MIMMMIIIIIIITIKLMKSAENIIFPNEKWFLFNEIE